MKTIFLIAMSFVSVSLFGQSDLSESEVEKLELLKEELAGKYQIEMLNTRSLPSIPLITFRTIERSRKQSETVYIKISENCRIKIPSKDEVNDESYDPLPYVAYINKQNK